MRSEKKAQRRSRGKKHFSPNVLANESTSTSFVAPEETEGPGRRQSKRARRGQRRIGKRKRKRKGRRRTEPHSSPPTEHLPDHLCPLLRHCVVGRNCWGQRRRGDSEVVCNTLKVVVVEQGVAWSSSAGHVHEVQKKCRAVTHRCEERLEEPGYSCERKKRESVPSPCQRYRRKGHAAGRHSSCGRRVSQ